MHPIAALDRTALARGLDACGAEGWLLYDFKHLNPIAGRLLQLGGLNSRRLFVYLPREGEPVAVAHKIELQPLDGFPGRILPYARWEELHAALGEVVAGRTVAMEVSPEDAVPYLDRVPYGVVELVRRLGGTVVPSGPLVTTFTARWSPTELADHLAAAEILARIAKEEVQGAVRMAGTGLTEWDLLRRVAGRIEAEGLVIDHGPLVAFGANAADPHYEPSAERSAPLEPNQVVLLDLFAGRGVGAVQADQTWMGFAGPLPPARVQEVWTTVRDARDAALALIRDTAASGLPLQGFQVDRAARDVIEAAGFGDWFVHRTGHSIDRELHGSGPHMDDYETRDDRELIPGVGFSVEPGIYLPGEFGVRSEVNVHWAPGGPRVTPDVIQQELILP
jgi:Xaa-Pro aminopeptidase